MKNVIIRTDGACLNNGKANARGGCAICVYDETGRIIYRRAFKPEIKSGLNITSNQCELLAFSDALQFVEQHKDVRALLQSDSALIVDGMTGKAKRKAHTDIWNPIEEIFLKIKDRILGVEHISSESNYDADRLASQAAKAIYIKEEGEWL